MSEDRPSDAAPDRIGALRRWVDEVSPDLDLYTYYQLLEVQPGVSGEDLRDAFYRKAAACHPDRFYGLRDAELRAKVVAIYARIAEGYRVLSDPKRRAEYDDGLDAGRMRMTVERRRGPRNPEQEVQSAAARRFLRLGLQALQERNWGAAILNLRLALGCEPDNAFLKAQLAAAERSRTEPRT